MDAWYFDENGTEHKTEHSPISQVQFDAVRRFLSDHHAAESMRSASPEKPKSGGAILGQDLTADFFEMSWKNGPRLSSDGAGSFGGELEALFRTTASEGTI